MNKILITGASSYVGAKIYQYLKDKYDVIGTYFSNKLFDELQYLDLTNKEEISTLCERVKPEIIIHTANYPSAKPLIENPQNGIDLNVNSAKYLADECKKYNSKLIFISSFAAYSASDMYGENKVKAEEIVKELENYVILRPSLIMGLSPNIQNDRPFNRVLKNITENTTAKYDSSWKFEVTYLHHLAEIIDQIIQNLKINKIMIPVVAEGVTSRYQMAKDILSSFDINVEDENQNSQIPLQEINHKIYMDLNLKKYSYSEVITEIVKELKNFQN